MAETQKKVLIVEDDNAMREIVAHKLASAGLQVLEAIDGKEAIEKWQKEKPDLVLLDLMLPEVDGFQVLGTMRKNSETVIANTPVIVLSNLFSKEDVQRTKQLTIEDFLVKAYHTTEEILQRVQEVLNRQQPGKPAK